MSSAKDSPNAERRNAIAMLTIGACFQVLFLFVAVFLAAQVFFLSDGNLVSVALFASLDMLFLFLMYVPSAMLAKRIPPIWIIRVASALFCAFILVVVLQPELLGSHYILFGAVWGAITGLFHGANNYIMSAGLKTERTQTFMAWKLALRGMIQIAFPFTFGLIIDQGSLFITSVIVLVICVGQFISTLFVNIPRTTSRKFQMRAYFRALRESSFMWPAMRLWFVIFVFGMTIPMGIGITIMILVTHGDNLSLGIFGSIFAATSIISVIIYKKSPSRVRSGFFFAAATLSILAGAVLFWEITTLTIVIFQAVLITLRTPVDMEEVTTRVSAAKYWGGTEFYMESLVFYETAISAGRTVACGLLIFVAAMGATPTMIAGLMFTITVCFAIYTIGLFRWRRRYAQ
ncbi:MAG: hypothetical protein FWE38_02480 [Firmicutes bacterium]|nr:hypothetical protein [Bacillota bacterium]